MQLTASESLTFFFFSCFFFVCAEVDNAIYLHTGLCTFHRTALTDFSLHGRVVSAGFWLPAVIQHGPLFLSFRFSRAVHKEEEEQNILDFELSRTSKEARWERSDGSGGEDSEDGGKDGLGWECTKKKARVYKKKDKRENPVPVCLCACVRVSYWVPADLWNTRKPRTHHLWWVLRRKEFRRD